MAASIPATTLMGQAVSPPAISLSTTDVHATRVQVTALRDSFVKAAAQTSLQCSIPPPTIVIEDVPSYGSYDPEKNTLTTPAWPQLSNEEKTIFYHVKGPGTTEADAREEFEKGVHHWVVIHELGHWWQACHGGPDQANHYAVEFGADRIAAAYWQQYDASIVAHQRPVFEGILRDWPNPVPPGQDAETYFNTNYEKLGPTPAYIWFQARMCSAAFDEKPAPSFTDTLKESSVALPKPVPRQ